MKVMGVPHIGITPFFKCNFSCPYCISHSSHESAFGMWHTHFDDIRKFLNSLDKKMILVSGGEPLIWAKWDQLIEETDHYWYFLSNCSVIPTFLRRGSVKHRLKLFISAYHRSQIDLDRYINNLKEIQSLGYPVFCKIIYEKEPAQIDDADRIIAAGIPMSFVPLVHVQYSKRQIAEILPYCQSALYSSRFFPPHAGPKRKPLICEAGTSESFAITEFKVLRCSHLAGIRYHNLYAPRFLAGRHFGYLGDIYNPNFYSTPMLCCSKTCACEWHNFSDMSFNFENEKWQHFIDTGEWIPATYEEQKSFVEKAGGKLPEI